MESRIEYMGGKRPCVADLDKYCAPQEGGDVVLDEETRDPMDCDESRAEGRGIPGLAPRRQLCVRRGGSALDSNKGCGPSG